jgi:hypothetical protein
MSSSSESNTLCKRTCAKCREPRPIDAFVKSKNTRSGWGSICLGCDRERVALRRADPNVKDRDRAYRIVYHRTHLDAVRAKGRDVFRDRQAWINTFKTKPCYDCGKTFPTCSMDFDHVRGEKVKGLGQMHSFSKVRILEEVAKCDVVCACCHRVRTCSERVPSKPSQQLFYAKVDALKTAPCSDCGLTFAPVAMDFDHVRGNKVLQISLMSHHAWERVETELSKCDLVCACCHRIRTRGRLKKVAA